MKNKIVIIGAGPAAVSVVETLRAQDHESQLVLLSAEPYPPYSPPAMVDHFLTGSESHLWRPENWPQQMEVDYRNSTRALRIEPDQRRLVLQDGQELNYDRLVIATGSRLYAPLEGADLPGVSNFKSLSAAEELIGRVRRQEAKQAIIVGAGFIGIEIALLLRHLGVAVTQVEMKDQVMPNMLDAVTAGVVQQVLERKGVDLRLQTKAKAFTGTDKAQEVLLESGEVLRADMFIAATGVRPNLEVLQDSGIAHDWGITVDEHLQTSAPGVYAAGDVVEAPDRITGECYVHAIFPNAITQGQVVGFNLLGYDRTYQGADRMNSLKHLGLPVIAAGWKQGDEVLRARVNGGTRTLYLRQNKLVGFQLVNDIRPAGVLRSLMNRKQDVGRIKSRLLEPGFGVGFLAWEAGSGDYSNTPRSINMRSS
jgi:nitrite reductase (NADH) large subunit